jgi:probable rRNA maturation factor
MEHEIYIEFARPELESPELEAHLIRCINQALDAEKMPLDCEVNVMVTDDAGIRAINRDSRGIDKATDVLSYPMFQMPAGIIPENLEILTDPETGLLPLGDMCISLERAKAQAEEFGHSLEREVGYLTVHSVLHLLGYDHLDEGPMKAQMRKREEEIMDLMGISR